MGEQAGKKEFQGFHPRELYKKGFDFGCVDLVQGGSLREVVGRITAFLLLSTRGEGGEPIFKRATVILPPAEATEVTEDVVIQTLMQATEELRGSSVDEREAQVLKRIVRVRHAPSLLAADVARLVEEQGSHSLVAVAAANSFRDLTITLPVALGATFTRLPEDRWAPHVTELCRKLVDVVRRTESYSLVHVHDVPARRRENTELLQSIDHCYVAQLSYENDPKEVLAARAADWTSMAVQGRLNEVEAELQSLELSEATKLHALTHLAARTGRKRETLEFLRKLQPHLDSLVAEIAVQVSQFAYQFGDESLAKDLLPNGPDGIGDPLWLEAALEVATELEDNDRIAAFDARLEVLVPGSEALRENRDRRLLMNCQEAKTGSEQSFTTAGFTEHHLELQKRLSEYEPDYAAAIEATHGWGQEWFELAVVCCAMHARSVERFREAADAASAITTSSVYGRQATQVLLYSVRSMMLRELISLDERDHYRKLFEAAFDYLAQFPADDGVRSYLISLLSVEACGDQGMPLIALTMLDLVERGISLPQTEAAPMERASAPFSQEVKTTIANAIHWLGETGGGEPGVTKIPRELIVASPDEVIRMVGRMAQQASGHQGEDADLTFMEKLVLVACAVCPYASEDRDEDIRLLRLLAANFAAAGQFQRARDFAEQILLLGQTTPLRRRLAWSAYADVYHRCHNYIVALVGMACALATDIAVPKADIWHEVYTIHRILRDLNLFDLSRQFLPVMKTLLGDLGYDPEKDARVVAADLALELMDGRKASVGELQDLLLRISSAAESALGDRNQLYPLAILLGQGVSKVQVAGGEVSPATLTILANALQNVGNKVATTIRTVSAHRPAVQDVLAIFDEVQPAAFAADVARDYSHIGLAARRLLVAGNPNLVAATESAFAIELLADHAVKLPSDAPEMTVDWPVNYAFKLNDANCDVVFMATDGVGELAVIHVSGREVRSIAQPRHAETFRHRFDAWLLKFPREYGYVDIRNGNDVFYRTMEGLDVRLPPSKRLVIVAEPALQQLTANLVVMHPHDGGWGFLAGRDFSIGAVPSLSWLAAARAAPRSGKSAYKAWISAQLEQEAEEGAELSEEPRRVETLDVALQRLSGSFEQFGFKVDVSRRLPQTMGDAGLAVVTAHGDLSNDGRFLRRISDDAKLVEAPSTLAAALHGVEVVILFVCSGGRIDKNPWDNSTTSLAKQLLNGGTRAVIASPWPLDVLVTYVWLEQFMKAWERGETVLDATKSANDAVAKHYGEVPQYSLALRVYGDVLLTRAA